MRAKVRADRQATGSSAEPALVWENVAVVRALAARRRRRREALRPYRKRLEGEAHELLLREAALGRALGLTRTPAFLAEYVAKLDTAFLPSTLKDAYLDLLEALQQIRLLREAEE